MMKITGSQLREERENKNLSQSKLSELSGISQHLLSAFENEKIYLDDLQIKTITKILNNQKIIDEIVNRKKRVQKYKYQENNKLPERVAKAKKSKNNNEYVEILNGLYQKHISKNKKFNAISLFSGCGGFSLGFSAAGFNIKGFVELDPKLREIYKLNFKDCLEIGGDIQSVGDESIKKLKEEFGEIDAIIGGPPCQGFSLSGKRDKNDPRNKLFLHYISFLEHIKPKFAVLENVRLLSSMKGSDNKLVIDQIYHQFHKNGYKVKSFEVNVKNYGVPQHRERIFFIAIRSDIENEPQFPPQLFSNDIDMFNVHQEYRTFADACSDLDFLESGQESINDCYHKAVSHPQHVIDWLWDVKEGMSAHENEDPKNRPPSGYNTTYKRQVWNDVASTVQTTFGMISGCRNVHPIATRSLTIREASRIQSFPDKYKFCGALGTIRTGIGNAVPPLLAYQIANYLKKII